MTTKKEELGRCWVCWGAVNKFDPHKVLIQNTCRTCKTSRDWYTNDIWQTLRLYRNSNYMNIMPFMEFLNKVGY